jgi:hypothetical protein
MARERAWPTGLHGYRRLSAGKVFDVDDGEQPGESEPVNAGVVGGPPEVDVNGLAPHTFAEPALALDWALAIFDRFHLVTARLWRGFYPGLGVGITRVGEAELLLFVEPEGHDMAAGDQALLQEVSRLLPARGYRQVVLPEQVTPLMTLRPLLTAWILNSLMRSGYRNAEQVAVLPDAALRVIRLMGDNSITALRAALATVPGIATPGTSVSVLVTGEQAGDLQRLLTELGAVAQNHGRQDLADRARTCQRTLRQGAAG